MRKQLTTILILTFCSALTSQVTAYKKDVCTINTFNFVYEINSKSDLDNFIIEYGACDSIIGSINISADIDFRKLDFIKHIHSIRIDDIDIDYPIFNKLKSLITLSLYETEIKELKGFNSLEGTISISLYENNLLTVIEGFNNLDSILDLSVEHLTDMTFEGFENVEDIHTIRLADIFEVKERGNIDFSVFNKVTSLEHLNAINYQNPENVIIPPNVTRIDLLNFSDVNKEGEITIFENVDSVGGFIFYGSSFTEDLIPNMGYKNLDFISHVDFYNGVYEYGSTSFQRFDIRGSKELSRCHVPSLCKYLETENSDIIIYSNAPGCLSISEVESACAAIKACTIDNNGRNDVTLRTQTEVDDFISQYGACERIYGDVHIIGDHDLSGFNNIQALGRFKISGMEGTELVGFDSIRQLQRLELFENNNLESLTAFGLLESVTEELEFHRNPQLSTIDGFQNLNSVGSLLINVYGGIDLNAFDRLKIITNELMIFNNRDLVSLDGLDSLSEIRNKISIHNNGDLNDLSALADLELFIDHLTISVNPDLSVCDVSSICNFLSSRSENVFVNITNNNMGCDSEIEVLDACNIVAVHDIYHDIINLYPNPTDSRVYIDSDLDFIRFHLYDLHGRLIKTHKASSFINLESFTDGIYILVLESTDHQLINKKIVKR